MLGILAGIDQKNSYAFFPGKAGIACDNAPRAVFSSMVLKPMMLRIMAGMLQNDSCPRRTGKLDFLGDDVVFFYGPSYLEVTCSSCLLEEYRVASFPGDDSRNGFRIQHSSWFNRGYMFGISLQRFFGSNFTLSYVKGGLSDPVVDPCPYDCKLWSLRSCSPSLVVDIPVMAHRQIPMVLFSLPSRFSCCSTLTRCLMLVVLVQYVLWVSSWRRQPSSHICSSLNSGLVAACPFCATTDAVVDVLSHFIDVGGRRCVAAATSSSCWS